ncbi:hypothetical protein vBAbaMPhT2_039 [Acinetobacter phage vB_AbaM_PhT2]|uniref:Uncharacterized protein n=2 Tax=Hadassahvirus TaxID=2842716 RepID=A0A6B9SVW6_9CAUD|nr:hypothetical protein HYP74_gp054 [Acinetobacter phage AbTZA1]YP_009887059.1 hypothetical protein HYQ24_gp039 [Acinetobacter phage vB_AbaM_PhT2]QQM13778.1 hypothetical protein CPT_Maestro_044 [Acinetobacter phage Maestro]QQM18534.1 hypothetical protein CPT_Morttis_041 [Acinetobacter phage Morttis]QQO96744.1 hypothetical protein CPT_Melin_043 [Acinetobacter phage Melin]SSU39408.1 Uncharacterised protein [Acinetobacter baumannii]AZU98774.1 hypothetical protein [Acinetobacter phage AbTZA1]
MAKQKTAQVEIQTSKTGKLRDPQGLMKLALKLGQIRSRRIAGEAK